MVGLRRRLGRGLRAVVMGMVVGGPEGILGGGWDLEMEGSGAGSEGGGEGLEMGEEADLDRQYRWESGGGVREYLKDRLEVEGEEVAVVVGEGEEDMEVDLVGEVGDGRIRMKAEYMPRTMNKSETFPTGPGTITGMQLSMHLTAEPANV